MRLLKFCSITVSLVAKSSSVFVICESIRVGICAICSLNCANCERRASSFSSVVIPERVPVPLKSEPELSEEPKIEEEAGAEDVGTFAPSLNRAMRKLGNYKTGLWTLGQGKNQKRS